MTRPTQHQPELEAPDFRALMAGFPTGVAVITTVDLDGCPWGMTCTAVCGVSLEPPMLLVCIRAGSPTLEAILRRTTFALNLLHVDAEATARLFASGQADRFDRIRWDAGPADGGPHLPDDAHLVADCRVGRVEPVGDHVVVFGAVLRVSRPAVNTPLLYGSRRYAAWPVG
jgi:flavin reductase (DIM6/NTAB) family NADH-FMN oxidoreductase RutF